MGYLTAIPITTSKIKYQEDCSTNLNQKSLPYAQSTKFDESRGRKANELWPKRSDRYINFQIIFSGTAQSFPRKFSGDRWERNNCFFLSVVLKSGVAKFVKLKTNFA